MKSAMELEFSMSPEKQKMTAQNFAKTTVGVLNLYSGE